MRRTEAYPSKAVGSVSFAHGKPPLFHSEGIAAVSLWLRRGRVHCKAVVECHLLLTLRFCRFPHLQKLFFRHK